MSFNSSNSSAGNRTSIFETFSSVSLRSADDVVDDDDDEAMMMTTNQKPVKSVSRRSFEDAAGSRGEGISGGVGEEQVQGGDNDVECIEEDPVAATLFMSCSPGRGSTDDDDDDDEDNILWLENMNEEQLYDGKDDTDFIPQTSKAKKKKPVDNSQVTKKKKPADTIEEKKKKMLAALQQKDPKKTSAPKKKKTPAGPAVDKARLKAVGLTEPKKPLSAYALFYRDTQSLIKAESPALSFGEVSKIVATMWDRLEPDEKAVYSNQSEEDRRVYMAELERYQQAVREFEEKTKHKKKKLDEKQKKSSSVVLADDDDDDDFINDDDDDADDDSIASSEEDVPSDGERSGSKQNLTNRLCARRNCPNRSVEDPRWCKDYCSAQCVVSHCRDVFTTWVAQRQDNNGIMVDT